MESLPFDIQELIWKFVFDFCVEEMKSDYNLKLRKMWADSSPKYRKHRWRNDYIAFASATQYSDDCIIWAFKRVSSVSFMNMSKEKVKRIVHYYHDGI